MLLKLTPGWRRIAPFSTWTSVHRYQRDLQGWDREAPWPARYICRTVRSSKFPASLLYCPTACKTCTPGAAVAPWTSLALTWWPHARWCKDFSRVAVLRSFRIRFSFRLGSWDRPWGRNWSRSTPSGIVPCCEFDCKKASKFQFEQFKAALRQSFPACVYCMQLRFQINYLDWIKEEKYCATY